MTTTQQKKKQRRVGRRRWAPLVRFLTETMKSSGSERVRMAAAEHLKEVLVLKEQRELIELKAAVRLVDAQSNLATTEQPEPIQETVTAEQAADRFLKSLKARRTDE